MLAVCDALFCMSYVLLFGMETLAVYARLEWLYHLNWHIKVNQSKSINGNRVQKWSLTLAKVVQMSIPLWLIAASVERYKLVARRQQSLPSFVRKLVAVAIVLFVCAVKLPNLHFLVSQEVHISSSDFQARTFPTWSCLQLGCPENKFQRYSLAACREGDAMCGTYREFDGYWNYVQVFSAFFVLFVLNGVIVINLRSLVKLC